jgi:hypothetical protein
MGGGGAFPQIVAVYSAFYAVYKVIASALQAAGFARRAAFMSGAGALCLAVAVAGAAWVSPTAMTVALAAFAANLIVLASGIAVIARHSNQNGFALGLHVFRPFGAAAAMAAAVRLLGPDSGSSIVDLVGGVAIGVAAYPLFLLGLWWRAGGRPAASAKPCCSWPRSGSGCGGARRRARPRRWSSSSASATGSTWRSTVSPAARGCSTP